MNEIQKEKYAECEREINRRIAEDENYALALSLIEYNRWQKSTKIYTR